MTEEVYSYSPEDVVIYIDGIQVVGWADDEPIYIEKGEDDE